MSDCGHSPRLTNRRLRSSDYRRGLLMCIWTFNQVTPSTLQGVELPYPQLCRCYLFATGRSKREAGLMDVRSPFKKKIGSIC